MPELGYDVVKSRLVVNEIEADRVSQIYELYLSLGSLIPTVHELNRRGWTTKQWTTRKGASRGGVSFTKNRLYYLLTNVTYLGKIRYKEEIHEGEHEAIVSKGLFQRVRENRDRNRQHGGAAVRNKYGALLRGLLYFGVCNCSMNHTYSAKGSKRYRYYVCANAQQKGWQRCPSPSVPAGEIEQFVVEQIKCIGRDPELVQATIGETQLAVKQETNRLKKERTALQQQKRVDETKLNDLNETNTFRLAELRDRILCAERRLTEISEELLALQSSNLTEGETTVALEEFDVVWKALLPHEQSRILEILIDKVVYLSESGTVEFSLHPTGIKTLATSQGNLEGAVA